MHSPILTVSLPALRANYRLLKSRHAKQSIAAVVKANAYGLGVEAVSKALWNEGCREFFVATLEEGVALRGILPEADIGVFNGLLKGEAKEYAARRLTPVLNDAQQVSLAAQMSDAGYRISSILHVDTGMTRLGLSESDLNKIRHPASDIRHLMSHLACANDPAHPKNAEQLQRFKQALAWFPGAKASLCNSSGLFLPPEFHFDLARPGCALYGINPTDGENPMQPVATLSAPILQIRMLDRDETVGYGASHPMPKGSRTATIGMGYADGWARTLSNKGSAFVAGVKVPVIGRVSMDMLALDVTAVPEASLAAAERAEFINAEQTADHIAALSGTIPYEVYTRMGARVKRIYR